MKDVPKVIEAVWKIESTRLIAAVARVTHDIGIAEEPAGGCHSSSHSRVTQSSCVSPAV
jgi:predicted RNA polymerase sigma factor